MPSFLAALLVEMGTETEDYTALSQRIGRTTGGIYPSTWLSPMRDNPEGAARLFVHAKAAVPQAEEMLAILNDILLTVKLDDPSALPPDRAARQVRGMESGLVPGGHSVVQASRMLAVSKAGWAKKSGDRRRQLLAVSAPADGRDRQRMGRGAGAAGAGAQSVLVNRGGMVANVTLIQPVRAKR